MLLTRIWGVILAALATLCLGGMFLLSQGQGGDFSESDRTALHAVAEAGISALEAQIESAPVGQVGTILLDPAVREALARTAEQEAKLPADKYPLSQVFTEASESLRVRNRSDMTVAVVDAAGATVAKSGVGEALIAELIATPPYQEVAPDADSLFSVVLGGQIHVAKVLRADANGRRLLAFEPLHLGAGSLLRRVLGTDNPAGIVRNGKLLGDIIGDQPVSGELEKLAGAHQDDAPDQGASKVFPVGEGLDARIGAVGRVPGPAGKGKSGALLAVMSRRTAAAGHRDLTDALGDARDRGLVSPANWVLLAVLLLICTALAIYLPQMEALGPMRRLASEFVAVSRGSQHQIFHDRYGGPTGDLARAANAAHEALRAAYLAELEIDEEVSEEPTGGQRQRPKTMRGRKLTRSVRKLEDSGEPVPAPAPIPAPMAAPAEEPRPAPRAAANPPPDRTVPTPAAANPPPARRPTPIAAPASAPEAAAPRPAPAPRVAAPPPPTQTQVAPSTAAKPAAAAPAPAPVQTQVAASVAADAGEDEERMRYYREVFEEFLQIKIACGENADGFTFDKFVKKLQKNTQDILEKHSDVRDVQFTVYVKDGKAALKAKVIRGAGA
ncbi:MAG: MXAN_5187 family protein [Nannocystaceae bacterium]